MKLSRTWSRALLALAIIATMAVGLVGTSGNAFAAASHTNRAEWTFGGSEAPFGFYAWTCELEEWCVGTAYTMNGYLAWDVDWSAPNYPQVTYADVSAVVPGGWCCMFRMNLWTHDNIYDGNGNYYGDLEPNSQPNAWEGCVADRNDALTCRNSYWGWYIYDSGSRGYIEFDHNTFIQTNDDKNSDYGWNTYYYWN